MHIDRTHEITVSREPASAACPISSLGLVFMPTARTLARCPSFGASEARDVSRFRFVGEIYAEHTCPWWPVATHGVQAMAHAFGGRLCVFPYRHSRPEPLPFGR